MLSPSYPERKRIRLDPATYSEEGRICSITICTVNRNLVFQNPAIADACITLLKSRAEVSSISVRAYCFMPDHVHLLIGASPTESILDFVRDFKSRITRLAWQHGYKGRIWQARYYDHFLRRDEDIRVAVDYILGNPVRRGMVSEWRQYPYCGSLAYEL